MTKHFRFKVGLQCAEELHLFSNTSMPSVKHKHSTFIHSSSHAVYRPPGIQNAGK
jgi:hypothetical protein